MMTDDRSRNCPIFNVPETSLKRYETLNIEREERE